MIKIESGLVIVSVVALILTKLVHTFDIYISGSLTIDAGRVVALSAYLFLYFVRIERLESRPLILLLVSIIPLAIVSTYFGIPLERMLILLLLTALIEEILLRGVLFHLLMKKLNAVITIIGSSLFFTIVHPAVYSDYIYAVLVLLAGIILGTFYIVFLKQSRQLAIVIATIVHTFFILLGIQLGLI